MNPKIKWFKVDLMDKKEWNLDFLVNCQDNKYIFEVIKETYDQVTLRRRKGSSEVWHHDKKYGRFIDDPYFHNLKIDDKLFEV
jgi:hypothetical protein